MLSKIKTLIKRILVYYHFLKYCQILACNWLLNPWRFAFVAWKKHMFDIEPPWHMCMDFMPPHHIKEMALSSYGNPNHN